ncbi:PAC2 family protein [Chloroflexota bacterium]
MEAIALYKEPRLKNPHLVAAWPGMGRVAIAAAGYLKEKLGAEEFGEIKPYDFFHPTVVPVRESIIGEPEFPESKFYFCSSEGADLIIFTAKAQPSTKGYQLANLVLDVAQRFKVKRVYTFAAAPSHVYHARKPRVLVATTNPKLVPELERYNAILMSRGGISGMNGLLLGAAGERGMDGFCLLGQIPAYTTDIANPRSSQAVLEVLAEMLHLEIDMKEIDEWGRQTDQEIEGNIERLRQSGGEEASRLVDYFEQLKLASPEEVEASPKHATEELFRQIEEFLKRRGGKEDH